MDVTMEDREAMNSIREEVEEVIKRYRRTLLVSSEKCAEKSPAMLDLSRDMAKLDEFQEDFRKAVAAFNLQALMDFKTKFFKEVFNTDSGFSSVNDLQEAEDKRFKQEIGFFELRRCAVKQEVDEDNPPSNDVVIVQGSEANESQWKDPVTAPVYVNKLGKKLVADLIEKAYRTRHLLQSGDQQVYDCAEELVKAAKNVQDVSSIPDEDLPMLIEELEKKMKTKNQNKEAKNKKVPKSSRKSKDKKGVKKVTAPKPAPNDGPSTSRGSVGDRTATSVDPSNLPNTRARARLDDTTRKNHPSRIDVVTISTDVEDDDAEDLPEPLVNDDGDDNNDDGGEVQQLNPENNTGEDQPKKQLPAPQDGLQGRRSRTKDRERKDDADGKKTKTRDVEENNVQNAGTSQESTTKDQHQIGKPHGHDVKEKNFEELRRKRKLLQHKRKQIEEKRKREEMEKMPMITEEDANEANGTSGTTNEEAPTPDPQHSKNSSTKKRAPTEGGEGVKTVDPLELVQVQLATTRSTRQGRKREQGQGRQAVGLTTHDLYVEHYRRVIQSLPDSVPPFTLEDLREDPQAVRKFMRCCLVMDLKPIMELELKLYENDKNWVNFLYREDGTLCQEVDDGREVGLTYDHLLLNPRSLSAPNTSDITNPKRSWDGKSVDIRSFPKDQIGVQTDPRPEKTNQVKFVMVGQGPAGLQYRVTLKSFGYLVQVLEKHFDTQMEFAKSNGEYLPDRNHVPPANFAKARTFFPIPHLARVFFPGDSIALVKQPASFHWGAGLKKPQFVNDRWIFLHGFYKKFYNAVLKRWKEKRRQDHSKGLEETEIQREERVLAKMKEVDEKAAKYRFSRWSNYRYGEVAKRKMFKKFVYPATRDAEEDVDESDDEDDEKTPGMAWLKYTYKGREKLFPNEFNSRTASLFQEAGYARDPTAEDLDRLKRELTQGGTSDSRGGRCSHSPRPRAVSQQPQPVARSPSPSPILRRRSRGTSSVNRLPESPDKETPARRKPSPFKFVDDDDSDFEDTPPKRKKGQKPGKTAAAEKGKRLKQRTTTPKQTEVAPAGSKCVARHDDGPSTSGAVTSKRSSSRISAAHKRKLEEDQHRQEPEDERVDDEAAETERNQPTQPEVDQPTQRQPPGPMVSALLRMENAEDFLSLITRFNHLVAEETAAQAVPAIALPPAVAPTVPRTIPNVNDAGPSAKKKRKKHN